MQLIFFFKQKTAYEMRISDWSSDVCSSDLLDAMLAQEIRVAGEVLRLADDDARDTELQDGAGAHHAGRQRGVERHPAVALLPAGAAQAVHLAVGDRIALLDAQIGRAHV